MGVCDEWGGAESRGNGARPVEWMIMNDTCATHRSRVPRRSFGRNKRRSDDIGRRERTRPGFYFMFCVWQSSVRGCRVSFVFVYLIKCVKCSPVPASFFPYIRTALQRVSHKHSLPKKLAVHKVLYPSRLTESWVEGKSVEEKDAQPTERTAANAKCVVKSALVI